MKSIFTTTKINLFYLALVSFVFISTSAISLAANNPSEIGKKIRPVTTLDAKYSDIPVLGESVGFPVLSSQSVMAVDLVSGVTLYEKDPLKPLFPASTTKIVTALVAMDVYNLDEVITVGRVNVVGQKMGLVRGETITIENLLNGLLIYSANDAAEVLASNYPEGREEFISLMNQKVESLGLINTYFANPTGLDSAAQYSTVKDLVTVSKVAMRNPVFSSIVGTKEKIIKSEDGKFTHSVKNINELLGVVDGVKGVKTGWTEVARENLVTYIERDGRVIMIAVLGSQDRFGETEELIDWIFKNYTWEEVKYSYGGL
ncbi:D-alanyl-D-alanine carboxypeptidase [Candidatus Microgenomates bacterium]|nr:D-alanyl-D-alanine carboxypeptidase [Candidatus Microgenomates bacterium]